MQIKDYYIFQSKLSSRTIQMRALDLDKSVRKDELIYDHHRLMKGEYKGIKMPVKFKQEYGNELRDLLDTGWGGLFLISIRMINILKHEGLTGWHTFPVKLQDKKGNEILGYEGLSITGRCGPVDFGKSKIIEKVPGPGANITKFKVGLHVGLEKWDGSDFFIPEGYHAIIISLKAKIILSKESFSNIRLTNLENIEIPFFD